MIQCRNLVLAYGNREVLSDFTAQIDAGTITAIIGANGSGKSTLLAALAGDVSANSGEVILNGKNLNTYTSRELASLRALAAQSHHYWMAFKASEILQLGFEKIDHHRLTYLIKKLNLASFLDQPITTLSGGQLQRIEIARALMRALPLTLLDEPFASQDLSSIEVIKELLIEERKAGRTIVLVAHARREDLSWCDQIIEITSR